MMTLDSLFLFCFAVIGMTNIVVNSDFIVVTFLRKILHKILYIEELQKGLDCHECVGTWVGFLMGYIFYHPDTWLGIFACGMAGAFVATISVYLTELIIAKSYINLPEPQNNSGDVLLNESEHPID